jgi:acyl-CoA synthetase (AMP-forming)/AMP-acid ligase II
MIRNTYPIPEELNGLTLSEVMKRRVAEAPNRVFIGGMSVRGSETRLTYAQVDWEAKRLASALASRGINAGDRIAIMLGNDAVIELAIGIIGVHELGGVFVPVNARFALEEVVYLVNKSGARALVVHERNFLELKKARGRMPSLALLVPVSPAKVDGEEAWHDLIEGAKFDPRLVSARAQDDMAEILFTSGTTGNPKGAIHTHRSILASSWSQTTAFGLSERDVLQTFMPLFTSGGVRFLTTALWAGCTLVFDPVLDVDQIVDRMNRERTTRYVGTSTFYIFLLDRMMQREIDISNVKVFLFGGSPTTAETIKRLHDGFPDIELRNLFGPTETGPAGTLISSPEIFEKPTSIGIAWPLVEVKVVDDDDNTLGPDQRGEICTRGPCIMSGYHGDPELSEQALKGGWHHTGDIGVIDDDGYVYIVDRKKDMIIRGGHNVASLEVEQVLVQHPAVSEAAVVGVPHSKLGEDLHAFLILRPGRTLTSEEMINFCKDKLADYKTPRRMSFVGELPRGPLGKVLKSTLRENAVKESSIG